MVVGFGLQNMPISPGIIGYQAVIRERRFLVKLMAAICVSYDCLRLMVFMSEIFGDCDLGGFG